MPAYCEKPQTTQHAFVLGKGAVRVVLVPEQPFASDHIGRRSRYKPLGTIGDESIVLLGHRSAPVGIGEGTAIVRRDGRGDGGRETVALDGAEAVGL